MWKDPQITSIYPHLTNLETDNLGKYIELIRSVFPKIDIYPSILSGGLRISLGVRDLSEPKGTSLLVLSKKGREHKRTFFKFRLDNEYNKKTLHKILNIEPDTLKEKHLDLSKFDENKAWLLNTLVKISKDEEFIKKKTDGSSSNPNDYPRDEFSLEIKSFSLSIDRSLSDNEESRLSRIKTAKTFPEAFLVLRKEYRRNPDIVAQKLYEAKGKCQSCHENGFKKKNGDNYLEVHHIKPLSLGGSDTLENTIALCANCHREHHYGKRYLN